ncbi:MAG: hypothetical protein PHI19_04015 [Clostridia bacterium]|nr:hypothetical protein [Clostridia bacterium]
MNNQSQQVAVKNLLSIDDILGAEKLCYEKLDTYIGIAKDQELKTLLANLKQATQSHYGAVYNYLKSHQS